MARQSVKAATDELDFLRLAMLDALLVLQADTAPVPTAKLLALIGDRASEADVMGALEDLRQRALVWGETAVRVAADAGTALPWHSGQVTLEDSSHTGEQIADLIDRLNKAQLEVCGETAPRVSDGTYPRRRARRPSGSAGAAAAGDGPAATDRCRDGDLAPPRRTGTARRATRSDATDGTRPGGVNHQTEDADAVAAGAIIDLLRELDVLLESLGTTPVPELRSGGLGVREVKRLAKTTGIDEPRLGLILEVAAAAGLIASGMPDREPVNSDGPYWAPTVATNRFSAMSTAERWHLLAGTWLDLPGRPALIGTRGPDAKPYGALTDSLYSTAAPLDRRLLLGMLAELPPGAGVDAAAASAALIWRRPRWARRLQPGPMADLLTESHALGLVGRGAISTPGRALLDEAVDPAVAIDAMTRALPKPDRPLFVASRPDRRGTRTNATRSRRGIGRSCHRRISRRGDGVPHQRAVDPARARHRQNP